MVTGVSLPAAVMQDEFEGMEDQREKIRTGAGNAHELECVSLLYCPQLNVSGSLEEQRTRFLSVSICSCKSL